MRALVTGGAGFIGSHLAQALVEAGHEVLVIDNLSSGKRHNVPAEAHLVEQDIREPDVEQVVQDFGPQAVFHLAAQMDVRVSVRQPAFDAHTNVVGLVHVAHAAVRAGATAMLFSSTGGAIYGEQETFPAAEDHPCRPESPYGVSKLCGEHYLDYFSRSAGLRTVAMRFANVYGPRQDPHGEAGVVAIFSGRMLAGQTPVINGDGGQTRDYVYVGDVVRANLLALDNPQAHGPYNVGTGIETDVNVLAEHIAKSAGYTGPIEHGPGKPGEQRRSVLDTGRAQRELGWKPEVSLVVGLQRTVAWFAEHQPAA